jgi:hypothetical protein
MGFALTPVRVFVIRQQNDKTKLNVAYVNICEWIIILEHIIYI